MMIKPFASFQGELKRVPFPDKASVAQLQVLPLITLHDHEVMSDFKSHEVPVYLNVAEHYAMLTTLVKKANELWPGLNILVRFSMPGGCQITPALLRDNVLILQDVSVEEKKLSAKGETLLVIEDNFAHFEIDNGDNLITLRLYGANVEELPLFKTLTDILTNCGVTEI